MVFLNAVAAIISNLRAGRIDFRTVALLAAGAIPAAALGTRAASQVSRERFETLFRRHAPNRRRPGSVAGCDGSPDEPTCTSANHEIRARAGPIHRFYVHTIIAGVIIPIGSFSSSLFGIGGRVIHVPAMTFIMKGPTRFLSAIALGVLIRASLTGVLMRAVSGEYTEERHRAGLLGLGALVGAGVGMYLSARLTGV